MAKQANPRIENILAYMAVGLISTSILAMLAALLMAATGSATPSVGKTVLPPILVFYPQFGLAAGALCIILLLIFGIRRRTRENRSK
jgi:drug/metabolite transporter (DMT)-like permease